MDHPEGSDIIQPGFLELSRKQVEEALRASEERYRLLMDSIRDHAVVLVDVEGRIRSWNPGAERVFGWKREEIVGQPIDVLFTPEDRAIGIPAEVLEQANRLGRAGADRWQVRKDGTRFYAAGSVAPVRSGNETMPSYVMILSDATQEKLAERVLQESGQVLREKAAPPTRSVLSRYGVPVGLSIAAALLWRSLPLFGLHSPPYILASLAVAFAAWWGGVGPGLVTTAGCALVAWLEFIAPAHLTAEIARWVFFICNGTILSALAGGMRQAIDRQRRSLSQLAAEIQERRRIEAAVREQAQMLDLSSDAVIAWQLRGAIRYWNSGAERLYGYSRAEAIGQVPQELLGTRTDVGVASFQAALERDGYWAGELRQVTRDGREVVVESRMVLLPQEADGPGVVIESARDITQRKWTEAALRSSEEQFRAFFENAAVGAAQTDAQNRLLQVNDCYCRITGHSREELVGMSPLLLDHPDDRAADAEKARRFFLGQVPEYETEKRYVRKDGRVVWVHVTAALIRGAGDRPTRTAAIVEDITQRKETEERLKHLTVTLEAEVQRRTAELQRRASQLQALAGRLAQAEEQERRRLAHLLHDGLQQLLVAAKMRLSWLSSSTGEEPLRTTVREAEDLLDQSIDQSRSLTAELSPPVLYEQGLEAGLKWLSRWMQDKHGFTVHVEVDAGQFEDLSVEVRMFLFQAVRELLFNAVKHAGIKQASVGIRMAEPDLVQVAVADQGVGFDPARPDSVSGRIRRLWRHDGKRQLRALQRARTAGTPGRSDGCAKRPGPGYPDHPGGAAASRPEHRVRTTGRRSLSERGVRDNSVYSLRRLMLSSRHHLPAFGHYSRVFLHCHAWGGTPIYGRNTHEIVSLFPHKTPVDVPFPRFLRSPMWHRSRGSEPRRPLSGACDHP